MLSVIVLDYQETTARGVTLLESVVLVVEPCIVLRFQQDLGVPACDVRVALSRLLLVVYLCPRLETSIQGKGDLAEEL